MPAMPLTLPPLGDRGWTPEDMGTLPGLPEGFCWRRPFQGAMGQVTDTVEIAAHGQRVALVAPLVGGAGWVVAIGQHREDLSRRKRIWVMRFDRGVDYVVGWVRKYSEPIACEVLARGKALTQDRP